MVELYLIRHAIAEERGDKWPDDTKRPLSDDGAARMKKAAKGLAQLGVRLDVIVSSPLVRTRQTADIVAAALDPRPSVALAESLAPEGEYGDVLEDLRKYSRKSRVALVGHEPNIGELAARLAGSRHPFEFKKGAVCRVDVDALPPTRPGALRWFLPPGSCARSGSDAQGIADCRFQIEMQISNQQSAISIGAVRLAGDRPASYEPSV
jgi:phosphohistidine phosphatase